MLFRSSGKPQLIIAKTMIGKGIAEVCGTNKAHGEAGVKFVTESRKALGLPDETFFVSPETKSYFEKHRATLAAAHAAWEKTYSAWRAANAELAKELDDALAGKAPDLLAAIPPFDPSVNIATRKAGSDVLQSVCAAMPLVTSGSADLQIGRAHV